VVVREVPRAVEVVVKVVCRRCGAEEGPYRL
jgi:ribosomal protein L40E